MEHAYAQVVNVGFSFHLCEVDDPISARRKIQTEKGVRIYLSPLLANSWKNPMMSPQALMLTGHGGCINFRPMTCM